LPNFSTSSFPSPAANFYHSAHIPNSTVAKQQTTPASFIELMISGESTEIFLTTLLRLKSKVIVTQFTRTTAFEALTNWSNDFTQ